MQINMIKRGISIYVENCQLPKSAPNFKPGFFVVAAPSAQVRGLLWEGAPFSVGTGKQKKVYKGYYKIKFSVYKEDSDCLRITFVPCQMSEVWDDTEFGIRIETIERELKRGRKTVESMIRQWEIPHQGSGINTKVGKEGYSKLKEIDHMVRKRGRIVVKTKTLKNKDGEDTPETEVETPSEPIKEVNPVPKRRKINTKSHADLKMYGVALQTLCKRYNVPNITGNRWMQNGKFDGVIKPRKHNGRVHRRWCLTQESAQEFIDYARSYRKGSRGVRKPQIAGSPATFNEAVLGDTVPLQVLCDQYGVPNSTAHTWGSKGYFKTTQEVCKINRVTSSRSCLDSRAVKKFIKLAETYTKRVRKTVKEPNSLLPAIKKHVPFPVKVDPWVGLLKKMKPDDFIEVSERQLKKVRKICDDLDMGIKTAPVEGGAIGVWIVKGAEE